MIDHVIDLVAHQSCDDCQDDPAAHPATPRVPGRASTRLPLLRLGDLTVHQSDCSAFTGLEIRLCDLPSRGRFATMDNPGAYQFACRPRGWKSTRLRISALGIAARPNHGNLLLIPPGLAAQVEWTDATGRIAIFSLTLSFIEKLADQTGLREGFPSHASLVSLSIDQSLEDLCQLLVDETEGNCLHGPLYFEALARALAFRLLRRARDEQFAVRTHARGIPPGISAAIQRLEDDFSERISVSDLARIADLSVDYFACAFRKATGSTPHQYLLRVRLSRACAMMTQKTGEMSLAQVPHACGFADQTHFCRHFRRFFGTTPTAFLRRHKSPERSKAPLIAHSRRP